MLGFLTRLIRDGAASAVHDTNLTLHPSSIPVWGYHPWKQYARPKYKRIKDAKRGGFMKGGVK